MVVSAGVGTAAEVNGVVVVIVVVVGTVVVG